VNNSHLTQALKTSIAFEVTEINLMRMVKYQRMARKAYTKWMEWVANYQQYDKAKSNYEMWALISTKDEVHDKAMNYLAVYFRCIHSYRKIKKSL
jgi:hypothetical protein